jgi:hypothetical protein
MIIDPEVEKTLEAAYIGRRKVSRLIRKENLEKFMFFYQTLKGVLEAEEYEESLITATIQLTAKYGDLFLAQGIQELTKFFKQIDFTFETLFKLGDGAILEFAKRDPFISAPVLTPGLLEIITAYTDCKPGEHRGALFLTTKTTFYDIYSEYLRALQECEEEGAGCVMENVYLSDIFFYVYGRTKEGEVYVVKAGSRLALEKEIQVAVSKELEKLQKYLPEERKLLKL